MSSFMPSFRGDDSLYDGGGGYGNMFPGNSNNMLMGGPSTTASSHQHQFFGSNNVEPSVASGYHPSQSCSAFQQPSSTTTSSSMMYANQPSMITMMAPQRSYQQQHAASRLCGMDNVAVSYGGTNNVRSGLDTSAVSNGGGGSNNNHQLSNMAAALNMNNKASMMYDYGTAAGNIAGLAPSSSSSMYGPSSSSSCGNNNSNLYPSDPQYRQQHAESVVGQYRDSGNDQQAFPTTLNDYYMAQQQQPYNPSQQQASLYGMMGVAPTSIMAGASSSRTAMYNPLESSRQPQQQFSPALLATNVKAKKRKAKTFPEKLMKVLMEHGHDHAVAWLPDGKSFIVVNSDSFVKTVLNKGFKVSKYASFVRKLHRWGFVRLTSGTGTDCFHHPLFVLGNMDHVGRISCAPPAGRAADKSPTLVGVERFIQAKVAETASETFQKTMGSNNNDVHSGMNHQHDTLGGGTGFSHSQREVKASALEKNIAHKKALDNSTSNPGKDDIEWGIVAAPYDISTSDRNHDDESAASDYKGIKEGDFSKASLPDHRSGLDYGSTGIFSPRQLTSKDKVMLSKTPNGVQHQLTGRFFNAFHEAKPSGLEELVNVANGLREQSMQTSAL